MRSSLPKVLHPVCGRPMVAWPVLAAREAGAERVVRDRLARPRPRPGAARGHRDGRAAPGRRDRRRGPRRARRRPRLRHRGRPLRRPPAGHRRASIADLLETHRDAGAARDRDDRRARRPELATGASSATPTATFERIVETKYPEGVPAEILAIREINTGTYAFDGRARSPRRSAASRTTTPPASTTSATCCRCCASTAGASIAHKVDDIEREPRRQQPRRPRRRRAQRPGGGSSSATCSPA